MNEAVLSILKEMNDEAAMPPNCYRRNSIYYSLVSYMNHIVALYVSSAWSAIPVFMNRAHNAIQHLSRTNGEHVYFDRCRRLLLHIARELEDWKITTVDREAMPLLYRYKETRGKQCPEQFCFHWVERGDKHVPLLLPELEVDLDYANRSKAAYRAYCGSPFGICSRIDGSDGNRDWYEPCEPLLQRWGVKDDHFMKREVDGEQD
ncbi:hypothetical protein [Paenibacillus methanolicus]|uniref:Uncharacterized protein n=1 Tax=Paenibacillus methanolicus TaxID=582686 RepID=A0A5S5CMZ5_9BACL|nr:hypothetical protein [Paenibacillus methanolicus]TYP79851.1 hypothetical protein BCM02_101972 [Paenibacillus methanolicus]